MQFQRWADTDDQERERASKDSKVNVGVPKGFSKRLLKRYFLNKNKASQKDNAPQGSQPSVDAVSESEDTSSDSESEVHMLNTAVPDKMKFQKMVTVRNRLLKSRQQCNDLKEQKDKEIAELEKKKQVELQEAMKSDRSLQSREQMIRHCERNFKNLKEERGQPPLLWPLGRVTKVFPGNDGTTRVVELKTKKGTLLRSFNNICPLPLD